MFESNALRSPVAIPNHAPIAADQSPPQNDGARDLAILASTSLVTTGFTASALLPMAMAGLSSLAVPYAAVMDIKAARALTGRLSDVSNPLWDPGIATLSTLGFGPMLGTVAYQSLSKGDPVDAFFTAALGLAGNAFVVKSIHSRYERAMQIADKNDAFETGLDYQERFATLGPDVQLGVLQLAFDAPKHAFWKMPRLTNSSDTYAWLFGSNGETGLLDSSLFKNLQPANKATVLRSVARLVGQHNNGALFWAFLRTYAAAFNATESHPVICDLNADARLLAANLKNNFTASANERESILGILADLPGAKEFLPINGDPTGKFRYFGEGGYFRSAEFLNKPYPEKAMILDFYLTRVITGPEKFHLLRLFLQECAVLFKRDESLLKYAERLRSIFDNVIVPKFGVVGQNGKYRNKKFFQLDRKWLLYVREWSEMISKLRG